MLLEEKIAMLIEPVLTAAGFRLVRVSFMSGTLQIMGSSISNNTVTNRGPVKSWPNSAAVGNDDSAGGGGK